MEQRFADWIAKHVQGTGYGVCNHYTKLMGKVFPELRRARGFYFCSSWGRREHWWLVTLAGEIVDPTAAQFPSRGCGVYRELTDEEVEREVPIGRCANCGDDIYSWSECVNTVCSKTCAFEYDAYLRNPC